MPIFFSTILLTAGIDPKTAHVVRHQDAKAPRQRTPYELWRNDRHALDLYQRIQKKPIFSRGLLASFVATPLGETLFVGLYTVRGIGVVPEGMLDPVHHYSVAGMHLYDLDHDPRLLDFEGKAVIEWGKGYIQWVQNAENDKRVLEIRREVVEPAFPGFLSLVLPLSELDAIPLSWIERLQEARGVYVITCPRMREHYVGSAVGGEGFYGRWRQHARFEGDAVQFRSREPSDYQVTILETAGSATSDAEVLAAEQRWMKKLQSREMGLNGGRLNQ
ncbi:GIY-YIG nuclease family protein [Xanthobacter flavus]|uniref:GIY-YIG nuclease family protein n=1 Tax=Xanthobacter flavus TaxID=281 RepID=UPI003728B9D0